MLPPIGQRRSTRKIQPKKYVQVTMNAMMAETF